jgi:hypothetical protein
MSSHVEVGSWLANPEETLVKLAELAVARRTVQALSKKADMLGDAQRLLGSGVDAVRPHAERAMAAAKPHLNTAVDWAKEHPELAMTLGGGAAGATLGAAGNLAGRKRKGNFLGDVITGGLAGTAVGGGAAALHRASKMGNPSTPRPAEKTPDPLPIKSLNPVADKAKLDALSAPTAGSVLHDAVGGLEGVARRNWLMTTLLGNDVASTALGAIRRSGGKPPISSHVGDLNKALAAEKFKPSLMSHFNETQGKDIFSWLKGLDQKSRKDVLLRGIAGQQVPYKSEMVDSLLPDGSTRSILNEHRITPEQLGHITSHGSPLTAHDPDGLLHKALGTTLPGSAPRRLVDWLRGHAVHKPTDRLARMGYAVNEVGDIMEQPGMMNSLRRRVSETPRYARGLPLRAGLMALPTLGVEGARLYNQGAERKKELAKHIADVMGN